MRSTHLPPRSWAVALALGSLIGATAFEDALAQAPSSPLLPDTLTLATAVARTLERDPRLAASHAFAESATAVRDQARAAWLPSVTSSVSITRFEEPMVVAPLHGFDPSAPPEFDRTLAQGRLIAAWTLFDGGGRRARVDGARAREEGAGAASTDARADAVLRVLEAWLRVLGTRDALESQLARARQLEAERARAQRYFDEGTAPRMETLRAEAELAEARAAGVDAHSARVAAEAELARLLGVSPSEITSRTLADVALDATYPASSGVIPDHPVIMQAQARAAAARALAREARASWLPTLRGSGGLVEYGSGRRDFVGEWQAGLQLDYPIFTGGARRARADEAAANVRRADAETTAVEEEIARAVDRAEAALNGARARIDALSAAVARYQELTRVQELALAEGAAVQSDYLRALAALDAARTGLADARRAAVLSAALVARAEGRLDATWIETHLETEP